MKIINKISIILVILLIIVIPIVIFTLNSNTNKVIEQNAQNAQNYAKTSAETKTKLENEYNAISAEIPGIVCIGSDLMASTGTIKTSLATELQTKLTNNGYKIPITNLAVQGENNLTILGRLGITPFVVKETVTIPEKADLVEIKVESSGDGYVWPLAVSSDNAHINPVTIDGQIGMLGGESLKDETTGENKHYFVRTEDGEPFTIHAGSKVETSCDDEYKDYVHIIWIGENDNWTDFEDLAEDIQKIVDSCGKNKSRYIVMGLPKGSNEGMESYDEIMSKHFGSHYVNVRKYLTSYDLKKTSIKFTNSDLEQQKNGIVPKCLLLDNGNLNDEAYKLVTEVVYNSLVANDCIRRPTN